MGLLLVIWGLIAKEVGGRVWKALDTRQLTSRLGWPTAICVVLGASAVWFALTLERQQYLVVMPGLDVYNFLYMEGKGGRTVKLVLSFEEHEPPEHVELNAPKLVWVGPRFFLWAWRQDYRQAIIDEINSVIKEWDAEDEAENEDVRILSDGLWQSSPAVFVGDLGADEGMTAEVFCPPGGEPRFRDSLTVADAKNSLVVLDAAKSIPTCSP